MCVLQRLKDAIIIVILIKGTTINNNKAAVVPKPSVCLNMLNHHNQITHSTLIYIFKAHGWIQTVLNRKIATLADPIMRLTCKIFKRPAQVDIPISITKTDTKQKCSFQYSM